MQMNEQESRSDFIMRLFDAFYDRVYAFSRKSAPADVAEDVTQEVFIRILQHPRLEELTLSVSYLIKVAHNLLRRRHSRSVRLRELLSTAVTDNMVQRHGRPDRARTDRVQNRLEAHQVEEAMGELTPDEQDAIRMIVWEGKSYEHAAHSLEVSVTTINNWKHRGLAKLRKFADRAMTADLHGSNRLAAS